MSHLPVLCAPSALRAFLPTLLAQGACIVFAGPAMPVPIPPNEGVLVGDACLLWAPADAETITRYLTRGITYSYLKSTVACQSDQSTKLTGHDNIWGMDQCWREGSIRYSPDCPVIVPPLPVSSYFARKKIIYVVAWPLPHPNVPRLNSIHIPPWASSTANR